MPTEPDTADTGTSDVAGAPFLFKVVYIALVVAVVFAIGTAVAHGATHVVEFVWRAT